MRGKEVRHALVLAGSRPAKDRQPRCVRPQAADPMSRTIDGAGCQRRSDEQCHDTADDVPEHRAQPETGAMLCRSRVSPHGPPLQSFRSVE